MVSTVAWLDEKPTESYYSSKTTTSLEWSSPAPVSLLPFKAALIVCGVLGTLANGLLLGSFWLCDRSKITSSSVHIVNHTTLEQS